MKKRVLSLLVVASLLILTSGLVLAKDIDGDNLDDHLEQELNKTPAGEKVRVIIELNRSPSSEDVNEIEREAGEEALGKSDFVNSVAVEVPSQAAKRIAKKDFVRMVEKDYEVELVLDQSANQINVSGVWDKNITGEGIDVAIIDTGIHNEHSSLEVEKERDWTGEGSDDLHGHGSHVAGIVASTDNQYKGVSFNADLYNAKALNQDGVGYASDVIDAIEWSVDNGAEIISLSLGASIDPCDGTDILSQAVDKAVSKGVVASVAAGNSGPDSSTITSPGCARKAITVGAVNGNDEVPSWSSRGPTDDDRVKPDVVAPGVSITSTWPDNTFRSLSGTSMATPHVSGLAALLLQVNSSLTPDEVKRVIKNNSLDLGLDENTQGSGRIQAYESYLAVEERAEKMELQENETEENETELDNETECEDECVEECKEKLIEPCMEKCVNESGCERNCSKVRERCRGECHSKIVLGQCVSECSRECKFMKRNCSWLPPGLRKRKVLPPGWQKKCPEAGTTPDSFWYGFDKFGERIRMAFMVSERAKARYRVKLAEERLAEVGEMIRENKSERIEELAKDYERNLERVNKIAELAEEQGRNVSNIGEIVAQATSIHIAVLEEVKDKVPKEAKQGIEKAINSSKKGQEEALNRLGKKKPEKAAEIREGITERRVEVIKERIERAKERAEEKVKRKTEQKEEEKGKEEKAEERKEKKEQQLEKIKEKLEEELEKVEENYKKAREEFEKIKGGREGREEIGEVGKKEEGEKESEKSDDKEEVKDVATSIAPEPKGNGNSESSANDNSGNSEGGSGGGNPGRGPANGHSILDTIGGWFTK